MHEKESAPVAQTGSAAPTEIDTEIDTDFDLNVRCASYFIASVVGTCSHCGAPTPWLALAVPAGHEIRHDGDWQTETLPAVLFDVHGLEAAVARQLQRRSAAYRLVAEPAGGGTLWSNHCLHCGGLQDEQALHGEPDVAFMPLTAQTAARIRLEAVAEPLAAGAAGHVPGPAFFDCMARA